MHVLVIGGTGFIGPPVVCRLAAAGHQVTVYHRGEHEPDLPPSVRHIHHPDAAQPVLSFPSELRELAPDVVLHMTLLGEADAQAAVDAFREVGSRLVMLSSCDVYRAYDILRGVEPGPLDPVPLREDAALRSKLFPYRGQIEGMDEYEKILAERISMSEPELPGTVLRLPMVYGPGDDQHRFFTYLKRMDDGRPAILLGDEAGWRSAWGYVENVAEAVALAVENDRAAGRIYNVADEPVRTLEEWVKMIGALVSWQGKVVPASRAHPPDMHNWKQDLRTDTTRIRQELGFAEPVPVDVALSRTIDWERRNAPEIDPARFDYVTEDQVLERIRFPLGS